MSFEPEMEPAYCSGCLARPERMAETVRAVVVGASAILVAMPSSWFSAMTLPMEPPFSTQIDCTLAC